MKYTPTRLVKMRPKVMCARANVCDCVTWADAEPIQWLTPHCTYNNHTSSLLLLLLLLPICFGSLDKRLMAQSAFCNSFNIMLTVTKLDGSVSTAGTV